MTVVLVLVGVAVLLVVAAILIFNSLVGARNRVDEAWSGIDVQLRRRHDLVPNLVAAVKGYADHERGVLQSVTEARATAMAAQSVEARAGAEQALSLGLGRITALAEQYPELGATENFQRLQAQLAQLEDEIQAARRIYNGNVQAYLTQCQVFPNSIVATRGPFPSKPFFELDDPVRQRAVPTVAF